MIKSRKELKRSGTNAIDKALSGMVNSLGLTDKWLAQFVVRFPDGSVFVSPRLAWCILIKAIVEQFCARFTPGGLVLYMSDTTSKFAHAEIEYLASIGIADTPAAKMPDLVVHDIRRNWLFLMEAVINTGFIDGKRRKELKELFSGFKPGLVFVTAFASRNAMRRFLGQISWETEVWVAEDPDHLIHFDGERFLGPYPDTIAG